MKNDPKEVAWKIVRRAIEEAEGRYGITLLGGVVLSADIIRFSFYAPDLKYLFTRGLSYNAAHIPDIVDRFLQFSVGGALRDMAIYRDTEGFMEAIEV